MILWFPVNLFLMWMYIFSVSLVRLTMEHIPGSAFRTMKSYLKLRNVWVWDIDAVFLGLKCLHISWSMNTRHSSSLIEALSLGPCGRPHIHRIVPFIYRNYTQFYFTDSLNSMCMYYGLSLSVNLESIGQANKSLIQPEVATWIVLVSF